MMTCGVRGHSVTRRGDGRAWGPSDSEACGHRGPRGQCQMLATGQTIIAQAALRERGGKLVAHFDTVAHRYDEHMAMPTDGLCVGARKHRRC